MKPEYFHIPRIVYEDKSLTQFDGYLYAVIYWFERLKEGKCIASNKTLADVLGSTSGTVQNSLERLEKAGCIIREYFDIRRKKRNQIRCLIKTVKVPLGSDRGITGEWHDVSLVSDQSIKSKRIRVEEDKSTAQSAEGSREVIDLFKEVNPSYKTLFNRKNQHDAAKRLLETHGWEKLKDMVMALPKVIAIPYAPKPTTPLELERDMGKLKAFAMQRRNEKKSKVEQNKSKVAIIT